MIVSLDFCDQLSAGSEVSAETEVMMTQMTKLRAAAAAAETKTDHRPPNGGSFAATHSS